MKKAYEELEIKLIWFGDAIDTITASSDTETIGVGGDEDEEP